jgi:glycosyltransferase involved in cell wall biosynthesis
MKQNFNDRFPVLYISYDGLLDPLGGSQIIPYIYNISKHTGPVHILSFEKSNRFSEGRNQLLPDLDRNRIIWHPLIFTKSTRYLGIVFKCWDFIKMYLIAIYLTIRYRILIVHARSHIPGWVALFLKLMFGIKILFDCRGLWIDERVDKGIWNLSKKTHYFQYRVLKLGERILFKKADHVVVLSNKVVPEVIKLGVDNEAFISVIPCCADFEHFSVSTKSKKIFARKNLGIQRKALTVGYLGSIGGMYKFDWYLNLIELAGNHYENITGLIITPDIEEAKRFILTTLPKNPSCRIKLIAVSRKQVPEMLAAMDVLVSFYTPGYARIAQSPTKNAEALAVGVPIISNIGIGDVEETLYCLKAGITMNPECKISMLQTVKLLDKVKSYGGIELRRRAQTYFDLEIANNEYERIYKKLKE